MGLGEVPHQARVSGALDGARTVLGGDPLQGRALHGVASGALHSMDLGAVPQQDRAGHGDGAQQARALRGMDLGALPQHDRAQHYGVSSGLHQADLGGALPGRAQGHGALPMPSSWESSGGGAGGTKAELPELPNGAMPLQFGDWLYLCGPIMRDISNLAGRWWDLTVRQAQTYYQEWKALSPLQRVQLRPRLPNELFEACFARTEQRGVHMLLKAASAEQQQELVVDRDLSSTAILFRLYIRHQPGGAGEKALLLGQLTSLQKATTMQELASSLRTWRGHFARAREVDASLPDGVLLLKALEMAVVMIAKEDAQASFRLSTCRQQLALDERAVNMELRSMSAGRS